MSHINNRVGEHFITNEGYEIVIVKYNNREDILVQFQDEHKAIVPSRYGNCKNKQVKNPYHPSVYGVGYMGQGKYKAKIDGKNTEYYDDWHSLMQRGFDEKYKAKHPTYKDVIVNPELYDFQDFAEWWHNNRYEVDEEMMEIDKDILVKGNKEYSFNTMIFVPHRINSLFIKNDARRGDCPIGVSYHKRDKVYQANCKTLDGLKYLGSYNNSEDAFNAYKRFKEQYIKEVADEYKDRIPKELYDAMYRYEVDIED